MPDKALCCNLDNRRFFRPLFKDTFLRTHQLSENMVRERTFCDRFIDSCGIYVFECGCYYFGCFALYYISI